MRRRRNIAARGAALFGALLVLLLPPAYAQEREDALLTVESLTCRGNVTTSCDFILSNLYLSAGDALDEREIREATVRLSVLRNFEAVSIYLEKGTQRGRAVVVVDVREARPFTYEATLGLYSSLGNVGASLGGRATHYNLFGAGKILDVSAGSFEIFSGQYGRGTSAGIEYIDPHLFGTKRNFMAFGVGYQNQRNEGFNDDLFDAEVLRINLSYGLRLWSFSYVTIGFQARPLTDIYLRRRQDDGMFEVRTSNNHGGPMGSFGWNSEDDPYFPTRGSRLAANYFRAFHGRDEYSFSFRKNWQFGGGPGVWTLGIGPESAVSATYARPFVMDRQSADLRRARWYLTTSFRSAYTEPDGRLISELGLRAGLQFETRSFGLVNFFVFGSGKLAIEGAD